MLNQLFFTLLRRSFVLHVVCRPFVVVVCCSLVFFVWYSRYHTVLYVDPHTVMI